MPFPDFARYLLMHRDAVVARWRELVCADPSQPACRLGLSGEQLDDHIPSLTEKVGQALLGTATPDVEPEGAEHGHQRRGLGYHVLECMWELGVFRKVLFEVSHEIAGRCDSSRDEVAAGQQELLDVLDRSMRASVRQYALETEQEREAVQQALHESHEHKDRFLATLAHELRNPITPILASVRVQRAKLADLARAGDIIERQARHQAKLINDLLDVSRIARGKIDLHPEVTRLEDAIAHATESVQPVVQARGQHLDVHLGDVSPVLGDPTRLAEIATNLLNNATKYTSPGGRIEVSLVGEGAEVVLRVRDTGVGITPEMLPRVFDMFAQADTSMDRAAGGLGLGLTLAKRLVEMQGGSITAASDGVGQGALFTVRLPAATPAPAPIDVPASPREVTRRRVLLVDDNADIRDVLSEVLSTLGMTVFPAADGDAALRLAVSERPEVCVIDLGLPGMTGYDLARRLRLLDGAPPRLIALTGYGTDDDRARARAAGFDNHMTKPADLDQLVALIGAP
ncbi:MAG TPA: hybrid sensor histidine kinase/response regulator [Candidatus Binatia bacterium]|jgi:signal transduction histidine kinase|nr:hybrid sensor histidine kinase/response regulator [Candidatus Binatia bacterium]